MHIEVNRFQLRDFTCDDRPVFVAYQMDPRYRALYDLHGENTNHADNLFDLFLGWQVEAPRKNFQLGIFDREGALVGSAGLRLSGQGAAEAGIELSPDNWGRYRLALDTMEALLRFGFSELRLSRVYGHTASGNRRVERLARRFGARIVSQRQGPDWMTKRGWNEVEWELSAIQFGRRIITPSALISWGGHE
ncbi:GNAT family N-acetyltransferase [Bradyrhizobium elkanii]|uniref:GNAT family N-acetyltransferase n=1 Tax=Bradyrhizobium elkanii TaxID=29448 RepID=UPI003513E3A0